MSKAKTIQVENYGDMLAQLNNMTLLEFYERGSYSGEYLAIMTDEERLFFYQASYGSCSGCDWLEDMSIEASPYKVKYTDAVTYCGDIKPKYIVPYNDNEMVKSVLRVVKRFFEESE